MQTIFFYSSLLFCITFHLCFAQDPNIGLLQKGEANTFIGYTLINPESSKNCYLIDNCGQLINTWTFEEKPGLTAYILENGNLLRAGKDSITIKNWDNDLVWSFGLNAELGDNQHHDIEPLPNGNVLCVINDSYTNEELFLMGRDTLSASTSIKFDKIIELQPIGLDSAIVVWEWKFIDHIVQNFDNTKPNFGLVADHPELLDLNFVSDFPQDIIHVNGIDYNVELDQILISARNLNEIIIIDHSTTTLEAASNSGGDSNKGGDFLWRWGNPIVYQQGTAQDQKLFLQHDSKWVPNGYLDAGKISVFNNLGADGLSNYSSIHLIEPVISNGVYQLSAAEFLPLTYDWSWSGEIQGDTVYQSKKSGTHALPNGNMMLTQTSIGQVSEITKQGEVVWTFVNPVGNTILDQYAPIINAENAIFRGEKYPENYIGFIGKDLSQKGIIEDQNSNSDSCEIEIPTTIRSLNSIELFVTNPITNSLLDLNSVTKIDKIEIYTLEGKSVFKLDNIIGFSFPINLINGVYILKIELNGSSNSQKIIIQN